jgi:hypothetical protein
MNCQQNLQMPLLARAGESFGAPDQLRTLKKGRGREVDQSNTYPALRNQFEYQPSIRELSHSSFYGLQDMMTQQKATFVEGTSSGVFHHRESKPTRATRLGSGVPNTTIAAKRSLPRLQSLAEWIWGRL